MIFKIAAGIYFLLVGLSSVGIAGIPSTAIGVTALIASFALLAGL